MAAGFSMLLAQLAALASWFGELWVAIFAAGWEIITDLVCWAFDSVLGIATTALAALSLTGLTNLIPAVPAVPSEILNILGLLGVGTALEIITAAIGIRLLLQLIPFTRLGS